MRILILTIIIAVHNGQVSSEPSEESDIVNRTQKFRNETYSFFVPLYKAVAYHSNLNFAFSPRSVWLMLAAIAEGSDTKTQQNLFKLLHLPDDPYKRQYYYQLMISRVTPANGVSLVEARAIFVDENLNINPAWLTLVSRNSLLDIVTVPMKTNPTFPTNWINRLTTTNEPTIDMSGNSVLLDTIDYNALWTTAFDDAVMENSPFYNHDGEEIGAVDYMKIKRRAKLGYIKRLNTKALELPVGTNAYYRMLFVIVLDKKDIKSLIKNMSNDVPLEIFNSLKDTDIPIDIAIPRFKITSEINMREILKEFGVANIWSDPQATKHISTPSAFPTSYVQRATLTLNKHGLERVPEEKTPLIQNITASDPEFTKDFIANQPLLFGLFDADTYTPLVTVGFAQPATYKYGTTYIQKI